MKTIKNLLSFALIALFLSSCLEDETVSDDFGNAVNTIGFTTNKDNVPVVANGSTADISYPVKVEGPNAINLGSDFNATITVDPSSTAVEGTNFVLGNVNLNFNPANVHTNLLELTIISDASMQDTTPTIVLNVTNVTDSSVLESGRLKQIVITITYLCDSQLGADPVTELAYDYDVSVLREDAVFVNQGIETITLLSPGTYQTITTGPWGAGAFSPTQGFDFIDSCGTLILTEQSLFQGMFSNGVYQTDAQVENSVVEANGDLHIEYTIEFGTGDLGHIADYIRQ